MPKNIYYYYNPKTDCYFKDSEKFPEEWGYQLLSLEDWNNRK